MEKNLNQNKNEFLLSLVESFETILNTSPLDYHKLHSTCDRFRISFREKSGLENILTESFFKLILGAIHSSLGNYDASSMALRCLTNALCQDLHAQQTFFKEEINAVNQLISLMYRIIKSKKPLTPSDSQLMLLVIRILYMLACDEQSLGYMYTELDNAGGLPCIIFTLQSTTIALLKAHSTTIDTQHLQLFHETCKLLYSLDVYGHIFNLVRDGVKPLYDSTSHCIQSLEVTLLEFLDHNVATSTMQLETCQLYCLQLVTQILTQPTPAAVTEFCNRFVCRGCVGPVLRIAERQLDTYASSNSQSEAFCTAALAPALVVLLQVVLSDSAGRTIARDAVFPIKRSDVSDSGAVAEVAQLSELDRDELAPLDAPSGTLRHKLISNLVDSNTAVRRLVSELLYALCNFDVEEFIQRVGFGNAVGLLHSKGVLSNIQQPARKNQAIA